MSGLYDARQRAANWRPADPGCNLGSIPGWYRELLGGLVEDLTRWREPEERPRVPRREFPRRCDPRHERDGRSGRHRHAG
jgi:hypothetical protein